MGESWRLIGVAVYSGEDYPLIGEFRDEESAIVAARERLAALKANQSDNVPHDLVYVVRPDGTEFLVLSSER